MIATPPTSSTNMIPSTFIFEALMAILKTLWNQGFKVYGAWKMPKRLQTLLCFY
jgi:hypothetical protein